MKKRAGFLAIVLVAGIMLVTSSSVFAATNEIDGAIGRFNFKQRVRLLFVQEKFKELEDMAREFRNNKSCLPEGIPKLFYFYEAFTSSAAFYPKVESDKDFAELFNIMNRWSKAFPGSTTERVAEAVLWLDYAWFARGTGYSDTVSEDGWSRFDERVQKAYELLRQPPKPKGDDCPQRYESLLTVGMAQGWNREKFDAVFNDAVACDATYYPSYFVKATYLLPRWQGKEGDWKIFADEAVKLTPKSEGMTAYARILWVAWQYGEWKSFNEPGVSWPKMKQGFLDMEKNFPDSHWNLNHFALFSVIANDKKTARKLFERIGDRPYLEVWKSKAYYDSCRKLISE